jgi:hypothetical protein
MSCCVDNNTGFKKQMFGDLIKSYNKEIDIFLKIISLDRDNFHRELKKNDRIGRREEEFFEITPLALHPLLNFKEFYICPSKHVMAQCLESFIYNKLKSIDTDWFMTHFGPVFENYIKMALDYSQQSYIDEDQLRHKIGKKHKVVDFIISDNADNILIDAKGIEMNYMGQVTNLASVITGRVESSILKGIEQAYSVISDLQDTKLDAKSNNIGEYIFIIVTYKELYLGSGQTFSDIIAKNEIEQIRNRYKHSALLPLSNIFFLTIEEYDVLIEIIKTGDSLSRVLKIAREYDSNPETRQITFMGYLDKISSDSLAPDYLKDKWLEMTDGMIRKIKTSNDTIKQRLLGLYRYVLISYYF